MIGTYRVGMVGAVGNHPGIILQFKQRIVLGLITGLPVFVGRFGYGPRAPRGDTQDHSWQSTVPSLLFFSRTDVS